MVTSPFLPYNLEGSLTIITSISKLSFFRLSLLLENSKEF